ncbi:MAG: hypothetical protein AABW51_05155 [Nanoarchaeota archaeon]
MVNLTRLIFKGQEGLKTKLSNQGVSLGRGYVKGCFWSPSRLYIDYNFGSKKPVDLPHDIGPSKDEFFSSVEEVLIKMNLYLFADGYRKETFFGARPHRITGNFFRG